MGKRIHIALGLISGSLITFQIVLMQILSITQWHHFAFMIISLALLGFGASGTLLSLYKEWLVVRKNSLLQISILLSGLWIVISVPLSQLEIFRFDTFLIFTDSNELLKLLFTYIILFLPFFFGAFAIGLTFVAYSENIGKLYFSNLLGSGIGGLVALVILSVAAPSSTPLFVSIFPLLGGLLLHQRKNKKLIALELFSVAVVIAGFVLPYDLQISQYKSLSKTLNLPDAEITLERNSPYGFIQVVESDALRYAPGLSLKYRDEIPTRKAVFQNGNWSGPIVSPNDKDSTFILDFTTEGLIYRLSQPQKVLILNAGTGEDIVHAVKHNVENIIAVEPNKTLNSILKNELAEETGSLYSFENVKIIELSPRTYFQSINTKYDFITLPTVGAFGGTSGTGALKEEYLLTSESFKILFDKLNNNGYITISSWLDYPYKNPLRLLAVIISGLEQNGIFNPGEHIISIKSWNTITFLIAKNKITNRDAQSVKRFCDEMNFDPVILPGITTEERSKFNRLQDDKFLSYIDMILSNNRNEFISNYEFRISPPNDNRPYFSQFLRWKNLSDIEEFFGARAIPFFELGYLIVILTLIQITVLSIVLIILPLVKLGLRSGNKLWTILYFSGLGTGYMFIEIVLIQKFVLYFGNPILSASAVISFMLICSGIGSYLSTYVSSKSKNLSFYLSGVVVILLLYAFILDPLLNKTLSFPLTAKILLTFIVIGIPAFLMGFPFPLGIKKLNYISQNEIPWAWGINGCFSVISTALATIISVELGFFAVFLFAAGAYGAAFAVNILKSD